MFSFFSLQKRTLAFSFGLLAEIDIYYIIITLAYIGPVYYYKFIYEFRAYATLEQVFTADSKKTYHCRVFFNR